MILKVNELGIKSIQNSHTKTKRIMISIYHGMYIKGAVTLNFNNDKVIIELGYNEEFEMTTKASAIELMNIIDNILTGG